MSRGRWWLSSPACFGQANSSDAPAQSFPGLALTSRTTPEQDSVAISLQANAHPLTGLSAAALSDDWAEASRPPGYVGDWWEDAANAYLVEAARPPGRTGAGAAQADVSSQTQLALLPGHLSAEPEAQQQEAPARPEESGYTLPGQSGVSSGQMSLERDAAKTAVFQRIEREGLLPTREQIREERDSRDLEAKMDAACNHPGSFIGRRSRQRNFSVEPGAFRD